MKNSIKSYTFLVGLLSSLIFSSCETSEGNVEVECSYEMNACEDCEPQYKILNIKGENQKEIEALKNKVINIVYKENGKEIDISEGIKSCLICYTFKAKGELTKNNSNYKLVAESFSKDLRENCCDESQ